jgi:hypothetical protein
MRYILAEIRRNSRGMGLGEKGEKYVSASCRETVVTTLVTAAEQINSPRSQSAGEKASRPGAIP